MPSIRTEIGNSTGCKRNLRASRHKPSRVSILYFQQKFIDQTIFSATQEGPSVIRQTQASQELSVALTQISETVLREGNGIQHLSTRIESMDQMVQHMQHALLQAGILPYNLGQPGTISTLMDAILN
jgi:hypothetical protein